MTELEVVSRNVTKALDNLKREIDTFSKLAVDLDKQWQSNSERLSKENKQLREENQRLRTKR